MTEFDGENAGYDLDFGTHSYFDENRVAEEVVWPLVDRYNRGDFRRDSHQSDDVTIRKSGVLYGSQYHVLLHAEHELYDQDEEGEMLPDEDQELASIASLCVETVVTDARRDMVLGRAIADDEDLEDEEESELVAKVGVDYTFDSDGTMKIIGNHVLEDPIGMVLWSKRSGHAEDFTLDDDETTVVLEAAPLVRLFEYDMRLLERGIYILQAPAAIEKALRAIRKNPNIADR